MITELEIRQPVSQKQAEAKDGEDNAESIVMELRDLRKGKRLDGVSMRDLISEGRE